MWFESDSLLQSMSWLFEPFVPFLGSIEVFFVFHSEGLNKEERCASEASNIKAFSQGNIIPQYPPCSNGKFELLMPGMCRNNNKNKTSRLLINN